MRSKTGNWLSICCRTRFTKCKISCGRRSLGRCRMPSPRSTCVTTCRSIGWVMTSDKGMSNSAFPPRSCSKFPTSINSTQSAATSWASRGPWWSVLMWAVKPQWSKNSRATLGNSCKKSTVNPSSHPLTSSTWPMQESCSVHGSSLRIWNSWAAIC